MLSKQYYRYAIIAVILIGWLALIDFRNQNNPRVSGVTVESEGQNHLVSCELWNPRDEEVHVMAILRLVDAGSPEDGVGATASAASVVKRRIGPRQRIFIKEPIKGFGSWNDAEVQVLVITDPAEIEKIAAR
jgi:hypothetical protein